MKRSTNLLKTSSLLIIVTICTVIIGEVLVRIILPQDKMITWIEMHPDGFVMNQSGGSAFHEFGDRMANYHFTKERLRGTKLDSNKVNILTIGDSFTFGLLLNEEKTYVHLLQEKADIISPDSIQFLNAAVGGSGLADWPGWLDEYGEEVAPKFLLYFMNYDDVNRALSKNLFIYNQSTPYSLIKSQRWAPRSFLNNLGQKRWYRWLQSNSHIANIAVSVLWKNIYFKDLTDNFNPEKSSVPIPSLDSFAEESDYSNKLTNAILEKINSWCDLNGCKFLVINTGYFEMEQMSIYDQKFYDWVRYDTLNHNFNYFDNVACVQEKAGLNLDEIKISGDSHPNERGSQIIANCTWEILASELANQ